MVAFKQIIKTWFCNREACKCQERAKSNPLKVWCPPPQPNERNGLLAEQEPSKRELNVASEGTVARDEDTDDAEADDDGDHISSCFE